MQSGHRQIRFQRMRVHKMLIIVMSCLLIPAFTLAEEKGKLCILPFRIHSLKPLDHLKQGLQEIFAKHMIEKGFQVIDLGLVNTHPMAFKPLLTLEDMNSLGKDLNAEWVIVGSLTHIGKKMSLDLKVIDISGVKSPFSISTGEDDIDRIDDAVGRAATRVYDKIIGSIEIDSILVTGNKRIENEAILAVIESQKGEELDHDKLDTDLRAIMRMGFFADVSISAEDAPRGKILIFRVIEKPSITKISFEGNKKVDDEDLGKEVGVKVYTILNRNDIRQSINRLKEYYEKKGYYNVKIREKIQELPHNEVSLVYEIEEGQKVYVTAINFIGNTQFDEKDLKDVMETKEKSIISWITQSGLLDRNKLEFDTHSITSFYHNQGYIKAKVADPNITLEKKGLTITIEIIEGSRYGVNAVTIEGDLIRPVDELLTKVNINKEAFFNREIVRKDTLALREVYADEGYAYVDVAPLVKEDDTKHLADITYRISKNKRIRYERINITGNSITRDKVIRRELKIVEGEYFSGNGLNRSTGGLHRLGFFEDVGIKASKGSRDDLMVIDVTVKERPTGSFNMGAGYSTFEQTILSFSVAQNNLFGRGQKLAASASFGGRTTAFDIRFTEPWFLDTPLSAGIDVFKGERRFDEYDKKSTGGALRFLFPHFLDEFTRISARYAYEDAFVTIIRDPDEVSQVIKDMEGKNVTSGITLGIMRNSKDKPWNTTKGSVNSLSIEYAGGILGGNVYFNKYTGMSTWYYPLWWDTVIMTQGRLGYIVQRPGGDLPTYEKFFLGGINDLRGFEFRSISPRDPITGDKIGGEKMWLYKLEYRFPFARDQGVVGIVFFDAGNVFRKDEPFSLEARTSVGIGIRWLSPVGPLRLEYGRNLSPRPGEEQGVLEFSVGGLF